MEPKSKATSAAGAPDLETTAALLRLVRAGDESARNRLLHRYLPILSRWARGRLPSAARDLAETDDLVQITLLRALKQIEGFEYRREGAFMAYLRRVLLNAIRDEARRAKRRPVSQTLDDVSASAAGDAAPPDAEAVAAYEKALATLPEQQQEGVILRVEFGWTYPQIAASVGSPSANAARMMVTRALVRLAEAMDEQEA